MRRHLGIVLAIAVAALGVGGPFAAAAFLDGTSSVGNSFSTTSSFPACPSASADWVAGLEHGTSLTPLTFTSTIVASLDSTVARSGTHSVRIQKGANSIGYARRSGFPISGNTHVLHFGFRVAALPSGDTTFAWLDQSVSDLVLKYKASTQKLTLQWGTDAPVEASSTLAANTWYRIEIRADTSSNPIAADWRIDGVPQTPVSKAETGGAIGSVYFGTTLTSEAPPYTAYYDDIVHSRVAGDYPFGDLHVGALRPNGNGTHVNPTYFQNEDNTPIDANAWQRLDDPTMFGGTDRVKQVTASTSSYLEFTWDDPAESCIVGVTGWATVGSIGSSGNLVKMSVFDGATESILHEGATGCGNCLTMRGAHVTPAAGSWTKSAVNGLLLRLGYQRDATPVTQWGQAMLEYAAR